MAIDTNRQVKRILFNGNDIQLIGTGCEINKLPQVLNKTVVELTADELRGLTSIPANWQDGNTHLEKIEIPNSVQSLGQRSFAGCAVLSNVSFEEGSLCTSIGSGAFSIYGSNNLVSIEFPDSVEVIDSNCFWDTNIQHIKVGNCIKKIGSGLVRYATLKTFILNKKCLAEDDVPILGGRLPSGTVYVPDETTQTLLQNATN